MAVTFVFDNALAVATRTNSTIPAPAGIQDGDILLIAHVIGDTDAVTPPSGFALWKDSGDYVITVGAFGELSVYWKRAASESGDYTLTHGSAFCEGWIGCFRGAIASGTPEDPAPTLNNGSTLTMTATGATTTVDGTMAVAIYSTWDDLAATTPTSGWDEQYDPGAANNILYVQTKGISPLGVVADAAVTKNDTAADDWAAIMIFIKAVPPVSRDQEGFRFRADDGSETTATWLDSQDTDITRAKSTNTRLRMLTNTAAADPPSEALKLQYRKVGSTEWHDLGE